MPGMMWNGDGPPEENRVGKCTLNVWLPNGFRCTRSDWEGPRSSKNTESAPPIP